MDTRITSHILSCVVDRKERRKIRYDIYVMDTAHEYLLCLVTENIEITKAVKFFNLLGYLATSKIFFMINTRFGVLI